MNHSSSANREAADLTDDEQSCVYVQHLIRSIIVPVALNAAIELDLLSIIAKAGEGAKLTAAEIAAELATKNPEVASSMLDRMLRLLATYSLVSCSVTRNNDTGMSVRRYGLAAASKYLIPDEDGLSLAPLMAVGVHKASSDSRSKLKDGILEGGIPFNMANGISAYEYAAVDPTFNVAFNEAMRNQSGILLKQILAKYDGFKDVHQLVDVGGGLGHTVRAIVSKYPTINGINFDLPHVVNNALPSPRLQHISGDMFEEVPPGDAILLKLVIHNWDDEHCIKLLKNCYKALHENGKVVIVEEMVSETPRTTILDMTTSEIDILMMTTMSNGMERTKEEYFALAKAAGFTHIVLSCRVCNTWIMELSK